ncbi:initiator tRNA phosphoribosyl transferase, partial [Testicularia cyperi]
AKEQAHSSWHASERLKRESRHIYNRLHSISSDSDFVRRIASIFPNLLLTANLRCGAWYTPPDITSAVSYFKSTDGHTHQWGFSLKRSNLHVLPAILEAGGCIIVDSTTRGKSMPDALSKTIPIWCAVLNRASHRKYKTPSADQLDLITPTFMIPPTEHDQIDQRIEGFVNAFVASDLDVPRLDAPLKPFFVTPQTHIERAEDICQLDGRFVPVILLAASRFIAESTDLLPAILSSNKDCEDSIYVQGAGDDHENWARGLTPDMFWTHHTQLLKCSKVSIEGLVDQLVTRFQASTTVSQSHWFTPTGSLTQQLESLSVVRDVFTETAIGSTGLYVGRRAVEHVFSSDELKRFGLIIHMADGGAATNFGRSLSSGKGDAAAGEITSAEPTPQIVRVPLQSNKKGLSGMRIHFPVAIDAIRAALAKQQEPILICCPDGKDLSGSLAIAALASCFDENRSLIDDDATRAQHLLNLTKDDTKRRLQWLVSADPKCSPSRAFLLRVNEILLSAKYRQDR